MKAIKEKVIHLMLSADEHALLKAVAALEKRRMTDVALGAIKAYVDAWELDGKSGAAEVPGPCAVAT
jgi:hypothetical protein